MNLLYNTGIRLYRAAARIAGLRNPKARRMIQGQSVSLKRIGRKRRTLAPEGFDLWIHSASLGEFEQARPLIDRLLRERPETTILASFFSPSGFEVRRDYHPRVATVYLPFDTPGGTEDFLEAARPRMAVFVKYEFWGNYLEALKRRGVPTYLISSIFRPGQVFFRPWGGMFRRMLDCFTHIYVQDEGSRALLAGIGVERVSVAGDTRFDRVAEVRARGRAVPEVEHFLSLAPAGTKVLVAGSSWPQDEALYLPWVLGREDARVIIAPHEFDDLRIAEIRHAVGDEASMSFTTYRETYSRDPGDPRLREVRVLVMNCFGLLSSLYRYGTVAYVGGGFGKSIHNINEAAVYGIPVVFGPRRRKFKEAADLIECGGGFEVTDRATMESTLGRLFDDPEALRRAGEAAGRYISGSLGATDRIFAELFGSAGAALDL